MLIASKLTSLLVIASLMLGNVAGWLHVGHHCVEAANPLSLGQVGPHGCCSDHACDRDQDPVSQERPVDQDHDSNTCSVCQNFLVSRDATVIDDDDSLWQQTEPCDSIAIRSATRIEKSFWTALSSRGPPWS